MSRARGPKIRREPDGRVKATLRSPWKSEYAVLLEREDVTGLSVINEEGFDGVDLDFLTQLPWLEDLGISSYTVDDVAAIGLLDRLERLVMGTYAKTPIDFARLPRLKECRMGWIDGSDALFECESLEKLDLSHFHDPDLQRVGWLGNLRELAIADSAKLRSTDGVGGLKSLRRLELALLPHLDEWGEIAQLAELEVLEIETCRHLENLDFVRSCTQLIELTFANCLMVEWLAPLEELKNLQRVWFWESTNVRDGDLSVLLRLPRLDEARFANRRHYSHTPDSIRAEITRRRSAGF